MPSRVSRQSLPLTTGKGKTQRNRKKSAKSQRRALNAYAVAEHATTEKSVLRAHRLGHTVEERGSKRRKIERDDEQDDDDAEDEEVGSELGQGADIKRQKRKEGDADSIHGSDSSGNEWRMGGPIGDDSDSSLDSDEAFGSSDEERFEDFTFRGSSSKASKNKTSKQKQDTHTTDEMDLSEAENTQDKEDDFGEDGVDLATMLDRSASESDDSGEEGDTESDHGDADSQSSESDFETDDANAEKISKLQDIVASLEGNKKRQPTEKGRDIHESQQPSDFGVTASKKLSISDLLPTVTDPALRKSLKILASTEDGKTGKRSTGVPGKLSAPLPKRQQDRIERVVAAAKAKEQLDKWQDTVIQNRRAEHLHFPLMDHTASALAGESQLLSVTQDKPANELESAIATIMEESGLSGGKQGSEEDKLRAAEELQMKDVPVEQVLARRAALRRARDLLFREEIKAKRIKKIKSKSFRRVHRRERVRAAERERELYGIDEDEEKERLDRARAEERMGLKHKESKWAKSMKHSGRTIWDDDARDGVVDLARRKEELRRRIEGKDINDEDDQDLSGEDNGIYSDGEYGSEVEALRLRKKLDQLDEDEPASKKGLAGMAFMQRAEAARKKANDETVEEIRRELAGEPSKAEDDADHDVASTIGRQVFGPKVSIKSQPNVQRKMQRDPLEEGEDSSMDSERDVDDVQIIVGDGKMSKPVVGQPRKLGRNEKKGSTKDHCRSGAAKSDDWLSVKAPTQDEDWLSSKPPAKNKSKRAADKEFVPSLVNKPMAEMENARKEIDLVLSDIKAGKSKATAAAVESSTPSNAANWATIEAETAQSASSDMEAESPILTKAQEQEQHRARAFAGEDVELAFDAEKQGQIEDEEDKYTSTHLPGWGSWTGDGLCKAARKAISRQQMRKKHDPLFKSKVDGVRAADRRDAKLKNVIISEARQRAGSRKYLTGQLPHEFERKEQYERSLRIPIGPEWTTKETFQRNTKPRVIVKQGIVAPLERPLV